MLEPVHVGPRSLEAYRGIAPDAVLDDLVRVVSELRGARELGQERVRQHFLLPRLLLDELTLMRGLAPGRPIERDAPGHYMGS